MGENDTAAPPLALSLRINLSVMMFLQFAIWGAWFVLFGRYLEKHGFSGFQQGVLIGNMALGAIFSPMIVGLIADRFFASERLMAVLHLAGAALLYAMASISSPENFPLLFLASLGYALVFNPTLALTNSIAFTHIPDATRDFPGIRVLGTIGWIVAGFVVGKTLDQLSNQPLLLAAGLSVVLGVFSLFLPHTPPTGKAGDPLPFAKAVHLFRDPSFAVFFTISGLITIVLAFYYGFAGNFLGAAVKLDQIPSFLQSYFVGTDKDGLPTLDIASTMLIGQVVEILFMLVLPLCLYRLGMKWVLAVGMLAWGVRYALFAVGDPFMLLLLAVALHGVCFDFFFAAGFIYVDNAAPKDIRGSAQALFALLTYGAGMWLGNLLAGTLKDAFTTGTGKDQVTNWAGFWTVPAVGVLLALAVFVALFRFRPPTASATAKAAVEGV